MRILTATHVFPRWPSDAVAPFLLERARALTVDHDVLVLAPHAADLPDRHDLDGVDVVRVRYARPDRETIAYRGQMHRLVARPAGLLALGGLVRSMRRAIEEHARRFRPDVIDVHWAVPTGLIALRVRADAPLHLTLHGTDVALLGRLPGRRFVGARLARRFDRIAAVSDGLAADAAAMGLRVDAVAPMPLRDVPGAGSASAEPRVLAVGRLVPEKGHADLVRAVAGLPAPRPRLEIVGEGPAADDLRRLAHELDVALDLPGVLSPDELDRHYATAACVAVPSRREGLGLVALEAMLAGVPVVATRVGGLAATVGPADAPRGFGVPPGDPVALRVALQEALTSPEAAARAARGQAYARGERARAHERTVATLRAAAQGMP